MTEFMHKPTAGNVVKLSGLISGYRCTRASASFVLSRSDQDAMGIVAVAAGLAGLGGHAASLASSAGNVAEQADYVEFYLGDAHVKGWVWRSPFRNGDVVDVAAEWKGDHYEAYGIARPLDKTIALYPHCSRARRQHVTNALKWWAVWNLIFFGSTIGGVVLAFGTEMLSEPKLPLLIGVLGVIFVLMFTSMCKQFMPFARLAENVFAILEIPGAHNLDLVRSSKRVRTPQDSAEFGMFYFRYR